MAAGSGYHSLQVQAGYRQILRLSLPISASLLVPQFNFITNNIFLGHYSREALATASIAGVYYLIFAMIGFGLNNGLQTLIARRAGENRPGEIGKIFGQGVFISLVIAATGILFTWLIAPPVLRSLIHDTDTSQQAIDFLRIRIWGLPFLYIYQMRNALLVGTNNSRYLVIGTLAETITNILFDYLFIFGKLGFPEMGFNGAAVASIIAECTGMLVIFGYMHRKGFSQRFSIYRHFRWSGTYARSILTISSPLIFQFAISVLTWEFSFILVEHHGQTALAVSTIMRNVFGLVGCVTWAFAATSAAMVSNVIGQGKQEEVLPLIRKIVRLSTGSALVIAGLINIFPGMIPSLFGQDRTFIDLAVPVVRVVTLAMVFMSFSTVWLHAVTGTGNSRVALYIELVTMVFYCVFIYLVLETCRLPIMYGWMGEWVYWGSIFLLANWYLRRGKWKDKII